MSAGRAQRGFTYVGFLIFMAVAGAGLASYGELASHATQREKEAELLFRGNAYREGIASYYKKEQTYPPSLAQLLEDKRYPMPVRHLRKLYKDPITGSDDWGVVEAPGGGVMGVHSKSDAEPIKRGNFPSDLADFARAASYTDWKFIHSPPGPVGEVEKSQAQ